MENKIQLLTDKLYQDGLSKGKEEGERLLQAAREQAARLTEEANRQAREIVDKARKEAEDLKNNTLTEIKITSRQMISTLKQEVEKNLMRKTIEPGIHSAMAQQTFMQDLILKTISCFQPEKHNGLNLEILLPESDRAKYESFLKDLVGETLKESLEIKFDGDLQGGFKIVNTKEGYMLSFTEEDFIGLFQEFARPRIKQLLF